MAQVTEKRIVGIRPTTVAAFEAVLFGLIGLVTAIVYTVGESIDYTSTTDTLLEGLAFGLTTGIIAIVVLPLIYALVGYIIGLIHGIIINLVMKSSGGIVVKIGPNRD